MPPKFTLSFFPLPIWLGLWQGRVLGMPGYKLVSGLSQGMLARIRVVATMGDLSRTGCEVAWAVGHVSVWGLPNSSAAKIALPNQSILGLIGMHLCRPLVVRSGQCVGAADDGLSCTLQHYTSDADGLCTRLIKPKVMEGTVAAQDEFFRSECHPYPQFSLAYLPPATQASWHFPSQVLWRLPGNPTHYSQPLSLLL